MYDDRQTSRQTDCNHLYYNLHWLQAAAELKVHQKSERFGFEKTTTGICCFTKFQYKLTCQI